MKIIKRIVLALLISTFFSTFLFSTFAISLTEYQRMQQNENEEVLTQDSNITEENTENSNNMNEVNNNVFKAGETVKFSDSYVSGDVFIVAKTIELGNIEIYGSAFIAGQNINLENVTATGTIYIAGQDLYLNKVIANDIYGASQSFVSKNIYTNNDIKIACQTAKIEDTNIKGELFIGCENAEIAGNTVVDTKCTINSSNEPVISEKSTLNDYSFNKQETDEKISITSKIIDFVKNAITSMIFAFVIATVTIALSKKIKSIPEKYSKSNIGLNILIGLATLLFVPIACIIILFIPFCYSVALTALFAYLLFCVISIGVGETIIGKQIANKCKTNSFWGIVGFTILVALIMQLLMLIPILGIILFCIVMLLGLGSIIVELFRPIHKTTENSTKKIANKQNNQEETNIDNNQNKK